MKKIKILIPAAGLGSRFQKEGYTIPKPFIPVLGKPMIQYPVSNFLNIPDREVEFIFVFNKKHVTEYNVESTLDNIFKDSKATYKIITIDKLTEGSACTCLKARKLIDNDCELIIQNSDQFLEFSIEDLFRTIDKKDPDGLIITTADNSPKWSFAKVEKGYISQVVEKQVISEHATVGVYYFKKSSDFVLAADEMINRDLRVNNEFYTCPAYNTLINTYNKKILNYPIPFVNFWGLGTPEDKKYFEENYK